MVKVHRVAVLLLLFLPLHRVGAQGVHLPFFDDFSNYTGAPRPDLWQQGHAAVHAGNGELPPTVGMLTLDALDSTNRLYSHASHTPFAADTACSQPIHLDGLSASDSVVFSFFYLPGGGYGNMWERIGDTPEAQDSLCLDFYSPSLDEWRTVWAHEGVSVDTLLRHTGQRWQYVAIPIVNDQYLADGFCFRFRNRCSLSNETLAGMVGNCDMWHVDYILIDTGRTSSSNPSFGDVAFASPAPSLLSAYRAMPAWQFTSADLRSQLATSIVNLDSVTLSSHYTYNIVDAWDNEVFAYDGGLENIQPRWPSDVYQTFPLHATPSFDYAFPPLQLGDVYVVQHVVRLGLNADEHPCNDTVRFYQHFDDYYAYDDGTAENGFGITSTSATIYLAYRFDLHLPDTLASVDLFFNSTYQDANLAVPFRLVVWNSNGSKPGTVLYRDQQVRHIAAEGVGRYCNYQMEVPLPVEGSIFVGLEQNNSDYINLGFDRSNNTSDRIYTRTSSQWERSFLSGSLMLRPHFAPQPLLAIEEGTPSLGVYPNPCGGWLQVEVPDNTLFEVYDCHGRRVAMDCGPTRLNTWQWPNGLYFIRTGNGASHSIIVTH